MSLLELILATPTFAMLKSLLHVLGFPPKQPPGFSCRWQLATPGCKTLMLVVGSALAGDPREVGRPVTELASMAALSSLLKLVLDVPGT